MFAISTSISRKPLLLAFSTFLCVINVLANTGEPNQGRTLEKDTLPFEPIEIADIKANGQHIKYGSTLSRDMDWLQGLTLQVKNISGKSISFISIQLRINPPESGPVPKVIELSAGSVSLLSNDTLQAAKVLVAPNNFTEITFNAAAYDIYKAELQSPIVYIRVGKVLFIDDTLWSQGMLHRRDSDKPNKWNVIESSRERVEEFYKKQRSEQFPRGLSQPPKALIKSVSYRTENKNLPSKSQCSCRVYGGFTSDVCEYCNTGIKFANYLGIDCGVWRLNEVYANCAQYGYGYCYPFETNYETELCF